MTSKKTEHPHYEILDRCGQGGMGVVYRARDRRLNRVVALKFLLATEGDPSSAEALERFRREAEAIAAINHPAVATIYEAGEWDGAPFLALEYLSAGVLQAKLRGTQPNLTTLLDYASQLGSGLEFAHSKGILHRDIKPGNCMFSEHGALKLVDFGLAKRFGAEDVTRSGSSMGTIQYMAPELLLGDPATVRSDLYAFGAVVYEMAAGRPLYAGGAMGTVVQQVLKGSAPPLQELRTDLPAAFCDTVNRATAIRPEDRFSSVQEFIDELHRTAVLNPAGDFTPTATLVNPVTARRSRHHRRWFYALAALLLIVGIYAAVRGWIRVGPAQHVGEDTLVVLPFENLGGNPANQALCDGLQETVTSVLFSAEELRGSLSVVPSSEVRRSQIHTVAEARKQFNATLVLTGSTQKNAKELQVTLDLTDARAVRQKDSRILTIPDGEIAGLQLQLADSLGVMLGAGKILKRGRAVGETTSNSAAYSLFLQGRGALEDRKIDEAVAYLEKATAADPAFALARAKLAEAYLRKNLSSKDPKWLAKADTEVAEAAKAGLSPEVLMSQALICRAMGNWDEAIHTFQVLLKSDPGNVEAYRFLAEAFDSAGRPKDAEATYREALRLRPGYWPLYDSLGNFYSSHQQYDLAGQTLSTGIGLAAETPVLYYDLGANYFRMSRWADAATAFEKSLAIRPTALGYSNLGTVRFYEGNYAEAARQCEMATRLQPANAINWGNLGDALWQLPDQREQARAAFGKASELAGSQLAVNPDNPRLRKVQALYLAKLGRAADAVAEAKRAVGQAPKDGGVEFWAARVYAVNGDADAAFAALKRSLALGYSAREIGQEPDFAALRQDHRYQEITGADKSPK